jgi:hypothetical protein
VLGKLLLYPLSKACILCPSIALLHLSFVFKLQHLLFCFLSQAGVLVSAADSGDNKEFSASVSCKVK